MRQTRSRSRQFNREQARRESQIIDLEKEREERRARREEQLKNDKRYQKRLEQARKEEAREAIRSEKEETRANRTDREKTKIRRVRMIYAAVLVLFLAWLGVAGWKAAEVKAAEAAALAHEAELQAKRDALREELSRVGTPEYIENKARTELHMVFPGETLYLKKNE